MKKPKNDYSTVRISEEAALVLRAYCDSKGLKMGAFLSKTIIESVKPHLLPIIPKDK